MFPVMYALLPNKRQETYDGLFGLIKMMVNLPAPPCPVGRWEGELAVCNTHCTARSISLFPRSLTRVPAVQPYKHSSSIYQLLRGPPTSRVYHPSTKSTEKTIPP